MKRISIAVIFCFLFFNVSVVLANDTRKQIFFKKHVEYPQLKELEGNSTFETYDLFDLLCIRYADDKTPVALCGYYDGNMFATVPAEYADREIEVFWSDGFEFNDDLKYSTENRMFAMFELLYMRGVVSPDENENICPDSYITRGKVCNTLVNFAGFTQNIVSTILYKDVPFEHLYYDDISTLHSLGVVRGTGNGNFEPDRFITREELVVIVARFADILVNNLDKIQQSETGDLLPVDTEFSRYYFDELDFVDYDKISEWARESYALIGPGVIWDDAYNAFYNPQKYAKKQDLAKLLFALLEINLEAYK